jgi:shikimate kinase
MVVTLIGYRGTGKTSVARPLAARLGFEAIDADAEIERRSGRTIREIFAEEGEAGFRTRERELMAEYLAKNRIVLAAGGGAILDAGTRDRIRAAGPAVWLRASVDTIERQIAADPNNRHRRPNLTAAGGRREIEEMLALREPIYRQCATITVDIDGRSIAAIVEEIVLCLGAAGTQEASGP